LVWGDDAQGFDPCRFLTRRQDRFLSRRQRRFLTRRQEVWSLKQDPIRAAAFRPCGGGETLYPGHNFAMNEILVFVFLVLTLFDMIAPEGGRMKVPAKNDSVLSVHKKIILRLISPVKVLISRRRIKILNKMSTKMLSNLEFEM
jgi:hypothetical protein